MVIFKIPLGLKQFFMYEDKNAMKKSDKVSEPSRTSEKTILQKSNSLPAGTVLSLYMEENGLCFEAVLTPAVLDKYQGMKPVETIKQRLFEIAKLGMKDPERTFSLNDVDYIDAITDCMYERLLEKGIWDAHFINSRFYSPSSQTSAGSLVYNGKVLSKEELISVGRYIEAVNWIKNDFQTKRTCFKTHSLTDDTLYFMSYSKVLQENDLSSEDIFKN
ncbi:hypothetical protein H8356DRAFT_1335296 [Neocallimastix lanati (nom. inval.)]|nr:hypothetical protein H8356DRAFT_1335296 [Neocallimastix sp. JGI-2020a]